MPTFLLSPLLWKLAGAAIVAIAIGAFIMHYRHLQIEAALVPVLQKQLDDNNARAALLAQKLAASNAARDEADRALSQWEGVKADLLKALKKAGSHAAAATIPVCRPNADDRRLRNDALRSLLGFGQLVQPTPVPSATRTPH